MTEEEREDWKKTEIGKLSRRAEEINISTEGKILKAMSW